MRATSQFAILQTLGLILRPLKTLESNKEKVLSKYSMQSALEKHLHEQEIVSVFYAS